MARPRDEMRATQAALLLRCQTVREQARRVDAARAAGEHEAAVAREGSRRTALADGTRQAEREIAAVANGLHGGALDHRSLDALIAREAEALARVRRLEREVEVATAAVADAGTQRDAANAALAAERRVTRKRRRLADKTADVLLRALDAEQEAEREDQIADMWRPA